jgi:hypothetical protein
MRDEIVDKIKKAQGWGTSRYQIDHDLLEAGHNPADIDAAWQSLNRIIKPSKRQILFRLLKSPIFWLLVINVLLVALTCSAFDFIAYYWIRFISPIATFSIIGLVITGIVVSRKAALKPLRVLVALTYWLWGTLIFFTLCFMFDSSSWEKTKELNTDNGNYYLIEKYTGRKGPLSGFATKNEYYEIHRCKFVIWCERVEREAYIDYGGSIPTNKLELLIERYKIDTGENK